MSDNCLVCCVTNFQVEEIAASRNALPSPKSVIWDKVDQTYCQQVISEAVSKLHTNATSLGSLDDRICRLNQILVLASSAAGPPVVQRVRRAKLKTLTPEIQQAVKDKNWYLSTGTIEIDLLTLKPHCC